MTLKIENIVKISLPYKNCNGNMSNGQIQLNLEAGTFRFLTDSSPYSDKGTFKISDIRELVSYIDMEEAKLPPKVNKPTVSNSSAKKVPAKKVSKLTPKK